MHNFPDVTKWRREYDLYCAGISEDTAHLTLDGWLMAKLEEYEAVPQVFEALLSAIRLLLPSANEDMQRVVKEMVERIEESLNASA